jgi:HD-like signal output (HDOD) protein
MAQAQQTGFTLVSGLAAELTKGDLKLPSLPEVVIRIRNALAQPEFTIEELARLVTPEPMLVGTILTMANSFGSRRGGNETTDLEIAISRIGAAMVQTAATTFALRQIRDSAGFKEVQHLLAPEWACASRTAAAAYLVAHKSRAMKADQALILGLIHNIGRIYLFSRAPRYPELFAAPDQVAFLLDSWHAGIGKAIVESWKLPAEMALAVERQAQFDEAGQPAMAAVLTTAIAIAALGSEPAPEELSALAARPDFRRFSLGEEEIGAIADQRDTVRQALGLGMG